MYNSNIPPYLLDLEVASSGVLRHSIQRGRARNWTGFSRELAKAPPRYSGNGNANRHKSYDDNDKSIAKKNTSKSLATFKKMYQFVYNFFDSSSIHGFGHLTARKRHATEYLLWFIFLLAALSGTLYISSQAWRRYQYFPTVISMERDYKNWNTSFPTATVCPDQKLQLQNMKEIAKKYNITTPEDVEQFTKFFTDLTESEYQTFGTLPDYDKIKPEDYMKIITAGRFNFTYQVSNSYDSGNGELVPVVTEMGICYTYNSEVAAHFTPQNFLKKKVSKDVKARLIYGSPLDGELFSQIMNLNSGYNMTITGPYDIPDVATRRMLSEPLYYKTLELTAVSILSSDNIRPLSVEQRKCRFEDESNLEISEVYTYIVCRMQCRVNLAYKLCKCIPYFYRKIKGMPYCTVEGMRCLGKHEVHLINLRHPETNKKESCGCYPLCNDVHFLIEMDNTMVWKIATNLKWGMTRYPKIRLKREIIFGFSDLLVSVGGTAGFFLGCSVLSFIEIIYFFTLRLIIYLIRQCKKL